jgi:hypothetical protein
MIEREPWAFSYLFSVLGGDDSKVENSYLRLNLTSTSPKLTTSPSVTWRASP